MAVKNDPRALTLKAAADLTTKQHYLVKQTATEECNLAGAGEAFIGSLVNKPKLGESASIDHKNSGTFKVILGGTVALNAGLKSDAAGKAIAAVSTNVYQIVAMQAGIANDIIEVREEQGTVA